MPRRRRTLIEGALYHVVNRFARGEDAFGDPEEAPSSCFMGSKKMGPASRWFG